MVAFEASASPVTPGTIIGRYVVLSMLGSGAMGDVFAAYDPELDRKVALKLLKGRSRSHAAARTRLRREAQALAKLDHRNVVGVHDVGMHAGQLFVGMEFVDGQTLGAWMASAERPWREVLRVFAEAGRGLAAAHEAGLVHRDIKPHNMMIGDDGRVRVMDFGLVRAEGDGQDRDVDETTTLAQLEFAAGKLLLDRPLTVAGTVMGTPAYMSAEQFAGELADPRSDQFGFCVSLYEALYGELPFPGVNADEVKIAVNQGQVRPAPKGSTVPGWVRKVVARGLATAPDERWPSMQALLAALASDPAVRRRKWWVAATVVGLLGGGAWGLGHAIQQDAQMCTRMEQKLEGVWDAGRRAKVEAAMIGTKLNYAPATWERVEQRLDDYTQQWVAARVDACEATQGGEQSGELLDLRMACLDDRLLHVRATVEVLAEADETVVNKAVLAVLRLPSLERCADTDALTAEIPPPEDPEVAKRVAALNEQLVNAKALAQAGKYDQSLAVVDAVVSEAGALDHEPLKVRAWLDQGHVQASVGDSERSELTFMQAYELAVGLRMAAESASASTQLVGVVGGRLARHEDGWRWAMHAKPLSRAAGTNYGRAAYLNNVGHLAESQGKYEEARGYLERALAILGPEHPDLAASLTNLGNVAYSEGKYAEARGHHERALQTREKMLGLEHPDVAISLNNLGNAVKSLGKYEEARSYHERALAIWGNALGPEHQYVAFSLNNLGNVTEAEGKYDEARDYYTRALAIREKTLGPEDPRLATCVFNVGNVAGLEGKYEEARGYFERALAIWEAGLGPEHPDLAYALTGLGEVLLSQGNPADALIHLERALTLRSAKDIDPLELAETRFTLARALWDAPSKHGRDHSRALGLAELTRRAYADAGESSAKNLEKAKAWQHEHAELAIEAKRQQAQREHARQRQLAAFIIEPRVEPRTLGCVQDQRRLDTRVPPDHRERSRQVTPREPKQLVPHHDLDDLAPDVRSNR
jgi:tetratricopeptide (TPR) repeat protein/predicted Ser/Thr protein kinase